jgi:V8-like Glu-specific endopeptidase
VRRLAAATALLALLLAPAARADTLRAVVDRPLLVVGGHDAPAGSWPSMAAIVLATQPDARRGQFCGGTVIAPTAVLTAAHCVRDDAGAIRPPAFFDVVVGRSSLRATGGQRVHVASVQVHPSNDPATVRYDAAVLVLAEAVTVPPMRLATPADDAALGTPGSLALVAGWGATDGAVSTFPDALQEAAIPLQSDAYCQSGLRGLPYDPASMACAAFDQDDADVCNGDSGGPLARQDAAGTWVQLGIVSWGIEGGCDAPFTPSAYAQVSAIRDWTIGITGPQAEPPAPPPSVPIVPVPLVPPPPAVTTTPAPVANRPPTARALRGVVRRGSVVRLRYRVTDDAKRTREIVRVWGPSGTLRVRIHTRLAPSLAGRVYAIRWRVPRSLRPGRALFCVDAYDVQGAHDRGCADLRVR